MCAASAVLTPQTANWGLFLTSRLVSLVWRTNPPDSSVLTCPSLSPTSRQLPALLFCLFQSSAAKMVLHSPDPSVPCPGSFPFEISYASLYCHSHFHVARPDLHPPSLENSGNHHWLPSKSRLSAWSLQHNSLPYSHYLIQTLPSSCSSTAQKLSAFFPYQFQTLPFSYVFHCWGHLIRLTLFHLLNILLLLRSSQSFYCPLNLSHSFSYHGLLSAYCCGFRGFR